MVVNIIGSLLLAVTAVFFGWLSSKVWRSRNALLKWAGSILTGLLSLIAAAVFVLALVGLLKASATRSVAKLDLNVAGTPEQIQKGEHIADFFCASCHSTTNELPLSGGMDLAKDLPIPLGSFVATNLTPAGSLKDWTDGEIFNAIRNGVDKDGHGLFVMSTVRGRKLSDEDTQAVIAYLRSQPAVENDTPNPPDRMNLLAAVMLGAGMLPSGDPATSAVISSPAKAASVEYGEYLLSFQDCRVCHGENLQGGVDDGLSPVGPNLTLVRGWTLEEFITTLRTGVNPQGHQLGGTMPWKNAGRMDDIELAAIYQYLIEMPTGSVSGQ